MHLLIAWAFSLSQVLSFPLPAAIATSPDGNSLSYVLVEKGRRSIWFARGPQWAPRELWHSDGDDGQEITNLHVAGGGAYVVYVRGGAHDANWPEFPFPDPASSVREQIEVVESLATAAKAEPVAIGTGDAPAISPDGKWVAFVFAYGNKVWTGAVDGSGNARQLFFDRGRDGDLQWSPKGDALAFTSDRGDHSFIGVYRDGAATIRYLMPSTSRDSNPQWSPDGSQIAFVRQPGEGGAPQNPLLNYPAPWAIAVADANDLTGRVIWRSGKGLRDSIPGINGPQLQWIAGNRLLFVSERTNWPHMYAVAATGGDATELTRGAFSVEDTAISPDLKTVYFTANAGNEPGDLQRRHLFRIASGGGAMSPVVPGATSQWWPAATTNGVAYAQAGARDPMTIAVDGRAINADRIPADFPTNQLVVPQDVSFAASDGTVIHGQLFTAPGGAAKKPGVIFVHGGPSRQMMLTWHYMDYYAYAYGTNQYLASHGFTVLSLNYRLGIMYGHDFQNPDRAGAAGASEYADVVAGAKFLQAHPGVDPKRIGIWGGSYGGYLTAMALAKNSDIFKVGVDWHGVHDWSMFSEWFGQDQEKRYQMFDEKAFMKTAWFSSPDAYISTWRSPVLLIHGDDDRNVRFHQTVDLVRRLDAAGVPYQELVIPNDIHGFLRWASWYQADQATADFLEKYLRP